MWGKHKSTKSLTVRSYIWEATFLPFRHDEVVASLVSKAFISCSDRDCKQLDITLFTVSHRKTLWKYNEYILQFDGRGNYEFKPMELTEEEKK